MSKDLKARFAARIASCESLDQLARVLNGIEAGIHAMMDNGDPTYIRMADFIDLGNLPIFGGAEIRDTEGVYSWDKTRQLEYCLECPNGPYVTDTRNDLQAAYDDLQNCDNDYDGIGEANAARNEIAEILGYDDWQEAAYNYPEWFVL